MSEMLRESGVRTLYGRLLTDVITEGDAVQACVFHARDQSFAVTTDQFVDAPGDLAVVRRAGGRYVEKDDGSTLLNRMANVDIDAIINWFEQHPGSYSPERDIPTSPEDRPYVFERFYRGDKARQPQDSASGLGLAIAQSLVRAHWSQRRGRPFNRRFWNVNAT